MKDVEFHGESCHFLLCRLPQPVGFNYTYLHLRLSMKTNVWLDSIAFTLPTQFAACSNLQIGTSDSQNVDPEQ